MTTCFVSGLVLTTIVASGQAARASQVGTPYAGMVVCCDGPSDGAEETPPSVACDRAELADNMDAATDAAFAFDPVPNDIIHTGVLPGPNVASTAFDCEYGSGTNASGAEAEPVPEPGTAGLVMLAGLTLFRRQRQHL